MLHLSTAYYLGIDPSEDLLDACLLQEEQVIGSLRVPNQRQGFEQLHQWCQQQPQPVLWVIEATGSLWQQIAGFAVEHGYEVYLVNPKGVNYYRKALLLPTKTDALDAQLIASYGRLRVLRGSCVHGHHLQRSYVNCAGCCASGGLPADGHRAAPSSSGVGASGGIGGGVSGVS